MLLLSILGDAEAEIRKAFQVARQASPCILFIDELDSIVTNRADNNNSNNSVENRILATFLTEMDGINSKSGNSVIMLGATNRLDFIDAALIRKGRFHSVLHVPQPDHKNKIKLLYHFGGKCNLSNKLIESLQLNLKDNMSGAEIENICKEQVIQQFRSEMGVNKS